MTNQAAQTMPEPVTASMCPSSDYAKGWNDCIAAISQPAGVPEGWKLVPVEPTDAMMEAAMQREDDEPLSSWGKIVPAPHEAIYRAMLAAAPAASGAHPDALPDGTLSKSTAKRVGVLAAASVSERAREVSWPPLARNHTDWVTVNTGDPRGDEYIPLNYGEKATWNRAIEECQRATAHAHGPVGSRGFALAQWLWNHHRGDFPTPEYREIHAALLGVSGEQALTQQRGDGEAVDRDAWAEALELPEGYTVEEFLPGGWHYAWTRSDGESMVSGTTWNHPALAAIAAWQYAPATTPQPSADAVRELAATWRKRAERKRFVGLKNEALLDEAHADELASLLSAASGEKGVGNG